ncbi:MAG: tRNA (adenosine(37)-N6)-dimethylallyltransferase MiaA [Holosporales bacterium]|jgi:tRNA dimethylallyltransferase|nr:tRNA (adenosine(37)-N6)-dimethylallyltransferase MiaA [Holosporales bacterium]
MIYFNEKTIIPIGGPTASGKSAVALGVAVGLEGTVVNADSLQLYKDLPILTACPSQEDMKTVTHLLYGVYDYNETPSAGRWLSLVSDVIESDNSSNVLVTVGGTGLYLSSLMYGLSPIPDISDGIRYQVRQHGKALIMSSGETALYACVVKKDPLIAGRIHPNHTQKLLRAWEVIEQTGRSIVYWQTEPRRKIDNPRSPLFVLDLDRQALRERIEKRCWQMVEQGVVDEVRRLLDITERKFAPICKAIGVQEFRRHIDGECSLEEAVNDVVTSACQYAKRQQTWFRTQYQAGDIISIPHDTPQNQASMIIKSLYSLSA